jgi:hypothetical protein
LNPAWNSRRGLAARLLLSACVAGSSCGALAAESGDGPAAEPLVKSRFKADSARDTWRLSQLRHYRFDISLACYCATHGRFVVTVSDGVVIDAQAVAETGDGKRAMRAGDLHTVDELFTMIDRYLASRPDAVELRLDRRYGYPAFFRVDPRYGVADDEMTLTIHGLTPIPPP